MTPRFLVITGTDTGVGKTVVGAGLAGRLARRGRKVLAVKPVESGCGEAVSEGEDGVRLARAARQAAPTAALVRLRAPLAPPVAADREGVRLDHLAWCREIRELGRDAETVLVEGAGGLRSPLTWEATTLDLAVELGADALVVATDRLGCLNQVLLTLDALRAAEVPLLGVVLDAPAERDESTGTNEAALRRFSGMDRIVALPRLAAPGDVETALLPVARWWDDR